MPAITMFQGPSNYPSSVSEVINSGVLYRPEVLRVMREFRAAKPWRGTIQERKAKFLTLHSKLCGIYEKRTRLVFSIGETELEVGNGFYLPATDTINLIGKLSVVTYLHEFAHAVFGASEKKACSWSLNLFKRIFPRSFERAATSGHMLVRRMGETVVPMEQSEEAECVEATNQEGVENSKS